MRVEIKLGGVPLPGKGSALKRHRQNLTHRLRNKMVKSSILTARKKYLSSIKGKDVEAAKENLKDLVKQIDTAAGKGVYHKNNVARKKSRLYKKLNKLTAENKEK